MGEPIQMNTVGLRSALIFPENLYWAWEKVQRFYRTLDGWYDELAVAQFEANLETELRQIARDFERGHYKLRPMLPLPQPKKPDSSGRPQTRQSFWVAVRDQVAWTAYMNIVGPQLDQRMPAWSYGNRLYRSVWYDDNQPRPQLHIGRYRNSNGQIYRSFRHSWPRYRRHVYLTIRQMSSIRPSDEERLGNAEQSALDAEKFDLPPNQRLPYLTEGYWTQPPDDSCWVSLDLARFYQSVNLNVIRAQFREAFPDEPHLTGPLLDDLLSFHVDSTGFTERELDTIGLSRSDGAFPHIPTGLTAAGFLANVALLKVDLAVAQIMQEQQVAVFRYVDDHIIIAPNFDVLNNWTRLYKDILERSGVGASIHPEKFEPREFGEYFSAKPDALDTEERRAKAIEKCRLDPRFPAPLMTQTLAKISDVARCDVELLDDPGQQVLLADLEHLMLAEFPKTEVPPPTRVSFAAGKIASVAAERLRPVAELVDSEQLVYDLSTRHRSTHDASVRERLAIELVAARRNYFSALRRYQRTERRDCKRTFWLLIKAVHDYPDKLRLWQHVLNYCRLSGLQDLKPVFDELDRYAVSNPLAARFVRATVFKVITWQLIAAARLIADQDALPRRRRRAARYIVGVLKLRTLDRQQESSYYYEVSSELTFRAAVGTVADFLDGKNREAAIRSTKLEFLDKQRRELAGIDWRHPADFPLRSGYGLAVWAWWANARLQPRDAVNPSMVWELVSDKLPVSERESWSFWKLHPEHLPPVAQRALLNGEYRTQSVERGWLLDAAPTSTRGSRPVRPRSGRMIDLVEWAEWVQHRNRCEEFDPRLGEWTCLEIARQVTELIRQKPRLRQKLHPRNFFVPPAWFDETACPNWEAWRSLVEKNKIQAAKIGLIRDARIVPAWTKSDHLAGDLDHIQGLAVLLLGLLRADFRWPAIWNPIGQQRAWARLAQQLIGSTACSSWTSAILESCLAPRERESVLMRVFVLNLFGDDDTANDPPEISTLGALEDALLWSQAILKQYQLSVKNHDPRQLIPIRLDQMSRKAWTAEEGDAGA